METEPEDPIQVALAAVAALRDELRAQVHTQELIVTDGAGRPRVTISVGRGAASVRVDAPGGDPSVELYAVDPIDPDGAEVGLALVAGGDVVHDLHHLVTRLSDP